MQESQPLEVKLLEGMAQVREDEWDALLAPDSSPFLEWAWLEALERSKCVVPERGWLPRHVAVYRAGKLVAAAPAYIKGNSEGEFVFDHQWASLSENRLGVSYYPKLILAVPFTPATGDRVLIAPGEDRSLLRRAIADVTRRIVQELDVSSAHALFLREDEVADFEAASWFARMGVQFHWHNRGYRTFDDFLATFSSKKRHQLRRERREVKNAGITLETRRGSDIDDETLAAGFRYYLATVDKFVWGRRYLNKQFFELVRDRWSRKGQLEIVLARENGKPIAGAVNIAKGKRLYGRYWGCDVERPFLHFEVCYYHSIEDAIARGLEVFEPGAGGEHKAARGFDPTLTRSMHWVRDAKLRAILSDFVAREREAVQKFVDGESDEEP